MEELMNKNNVALTPPMGWNSWDCYMSTVTEEQLLEQARYMAAHLKPFGWQYIVCDIQWYEPTAGTVPGTEYIPFAKLHMDAYGRLLPAENRFPSAAFGQGFAPIARQVHDMGLKFGIHIMRGIPRQAVYARCPILGTDTTADAIADPFSISKWNGDMFGLRDVPSAQAYYNSLFTLYAEWGVDFVKVDDIANTNMYPQNPYAAEREIEMIRSAIDACGREMVLSLSPGPSVIEKAWHLKRHANMWRMTDDFWDSWSALLSMFERCEVWQAHVEPGCWPDCDMLPLGRIGVAFGKDRQTSFTKDEQITMMTLWSIFRSPLMLGGVLSESDDFTLSLITNEELLRLHAHSYGAQQHMRNQHEAVWCSHADDGGQYVAMFNLSDAARKLSMDLSDLGISGASVRDIWAKTAYGTKVMRIETLVPAHGAKLFYVDRYHQA